MLQSHTMRPSSPSGLLQQHWSMQQGVPVRTPQPLLQSARRRPCRGRRQGVAHAAAAAFQSPASNKYRTRQEIERDYYKEWERITLLAEQLGKRKMTAATMVAFLPTWFKFYVVPPPLRFLWYFVWVALKQLAHQVQKRLVTQGAKLDAALMRRAGGSPGPELCSVALQRLHGKVSLWSDVVYRWRLLQRDLSARPAVHQNRIEAEAAEWRMAAEQTAAWQPEPSEA